jgi:hypothetical protein
VLNKNQVGRTETGRSFPIMKQSLVFFFQPVRMSFRDELERPIVAHGLGLTQPDLAEAAPAEKADQAVAVEDFEWGRVSCHV